MLVKKYAIYRIKESQYDSFSKLNVSNYNNNEFNVKFNNITNYFNSFEFISKDSLTLKNIDDNHDSLYFDSEYEAIKAVEANRYLPIINFSEYGTSITVLPILVEILDTNIQEIRRLKIKGILQDDGQ